MSSAVKFQLKFCTFLLISWWPKSWYRLSADSRATSIVFLIFVVKSTFFPKNAKIKCWMNKNLIRTVKKSYTLTGRLAVSRRGLLYPGWRALVAFFANIEKKRERGIHFYCTLPHLSFSSCQQNLMKTFQIEAIVALITKMPLIFSWDLLNGQK